MWKWLDGISFRQKLALFSTLVTVTIICLNTIFYQSIIKASNSMVFEKTADSLVHSAASVQRELDILRDLTYNMIGDSSIQNTLRDYTQLSFKKDRELLQRYLSANIVSREGIRSITLILPDTPLIVGNHLSSLLAEQRNELIEQARRAKGRGVYDFSADRQFLYFARQIRQSQDLMLNELAIIIIEVKIANVVEVSDLNSQFSVLSREDARRQYGISDDKGGQGYSIQSLNGERFFITFLHSPDRAWTYLVITPYQQLYGKIQTMKYMMWVSMILLLVLTVFLNNRLIKRMIQPIDILVEKTKKDNIDSLELTNEMILYWDRKDEIGSLYRAVWTMNQNTKRLIEENYRSALLINETQLKALQMQINPHFLYNTLESIHSLAVLNKQKKITTLVEALGILLRHSINERNSMVTLEEELQIAQEYFSIQKIRFEDRLEWEINVPESLLQVVLPKMILQPLLENAIKYGLESDEMCSVIRIWAARSGDDVLIHVQDNGRNAPIERMAAIAYGELPTESSSIGLHNIHQRIQLVYGKDYGLEFSGGEQGTTVSIRTALNRKG